MVHNLILIGFKKRIMVLAVLFVIPNWALRLVEKYKGSEKFIKGNFFRHIFQKFDFPKNFNPKMNQQAGMLIFRRFFRHQDQPN